MNLDFRHIPVFCSFKKESQSCRNIKYNNLINKELIIERSIQWQRNPKSYIKLNCRVTFS